MRARLAIGISICVGLGLAAWVERDRVGDLAGLALARLERPAAPSVTTLPPGEVPDSPPSGDPPAEDGRAQAAAASPHGMGLPQSLDGLFDALRRAETVEQAQQIEARIFLRLGTASGATVNALMEAAARAEDMEDWGRARTIYADITRIDPAFADGWARAASSAWQMGDHAAARADLLVALRLEPRHFAAWAGLATIYEETGYVVEADRAWREALYWNPMMDGARRGAARTAAILRGLSL